MVREAPPCKGRPCLQRPVLGRSDTILSPKQQSVAAYCAAALHSGVPVISVANIGQLLAFWQQRTEHILNIT